MCRHGSTVLPLHQEDKTMAETAGIAPVKSAAKEAAAPGVWPSLENLRREMERLFDDFRFDFGGSPFRRGRLLEPFSRGDMSWGAIPAVDIAEKDNAYEITAELPGIDEKDIEVKYGSGMLTIRGEKQAEKEEKKKDYHLSERSYGSFQRSFSLPGGVDADKLSADFKNGILTISVPKMADAKKQEKKIAINAG
jgi:HSP20 family protein